MYATPRVSIAHAILAITQSVIRFCGLLLGGCIHEPTTHVGGLLSFADGATARVFRETVVDQQRTDTPAVLVVEFRLRAAHRLAHRLFQIESVLNTPIFAGFPGFVSKLWLTDDEHEVYRGIYEWDGAPHAESYARVLCRLLAPVTVPGSVDYRVFPGERRARFLAECECLTSDAPAGATAWWRPA
jgi:hypothetical protein